MIFKHDYVDCGEPNDSYLPEVGINFVVLHRVAMVPSIQSMVGYLLATLRINQF